MRAPVLLIDGRSGSGKTELARAIVAAAPGVQLVRLDDLYPGWGGLEAGSALAHELLSSPIPRWERWDWPTSAREEWHDVDPDAPLVIEGCGALSAANRRLASFGVWVALDDATRKARALERDGDTFAPHWDEWALQEDGFIARENPALLADAIVDGHHSAEGLERWLSVLGVE